MCGIGRDGGVDGEGRAPYWDSVRLVDFLPDAAEQQQRRWQMTQQAAVRDVRSDPIPPAAVDSVLFSAWRSLASAGLMRRWVGWVGLGLQDPDAQVSIMKRAFQLGRGVSVQRQTGEQLTPVLLQRLAQALDLAPSVDLRGCIIRPDGGGEGTVSVEGHILLDRRHSPPTWARQLMLVSIGAILCVVGDARAVAEQPSAHSQPYRQARFMNTWARLAIFMQVDMERVSAVRSAMKAVQTSEMALAVAMGVPLVATAVAHSLDARYSAFMHRALAYARDRPPPGASVEDSCPVFVWPPDAQPPRRLFSVCADREMVLVPMNATPEQLWRCMEATAAESTTLLQSIRAREAEQARVRDRAMRTLRLRRLQRGDDVSAAQYLQCCRALYQNAAALAPVAQGLSLRVASSNGVSECGTYIDIQHDSL